MFILGNPIGVIIDWIIYIIMNYFRAESDYSIQSDEGNKEMKYSNLIPKFLKKPYEVVNTENGTSMS